LPYDEYALRVFKLNSNYYILKLIDEDDLEVAVQEFRPRMQNNESLKMNFDEVRKMLSASLKKNIKRDSLLE
jgi:two-component system response regulator LytT